MPQQTERPYPGHLAVGGRTGGSSYGVGHAHFGSWTPLRHTFAAVDSDVRVLESEHDPASADSAQGTQSPPQPRGRLSRLTDDLRQSATPRLRRLGIGGLEADGLRAWLLSRIPMALITWAVIWTGFGYDGDFKPHGWASVWQRWDWLRYVSIAEHGYTLNARHGASIAFFPGYPILLYAVHLVFRSWVYSGLLISFVTGAIACMALVRIIAMEAEAAGLSKDGVRAAARDGALLFVFAPAAVFMAAGYTESPFLACALWAWVAARREKWLIAGVLLAIGSAIHINGLFIMVAVAVLFLQTRPRGLRGWLRGWPIALPVVPVFAFMAYLYKLTHSWDAWQHAEAVGWDRRTQYPWNTFLETWKYAFGHYIIAENAWEYQLELVVTFLGMGFTLWLLYKRRWAEFTYLAISIGALATSHVYLSVPREMLTWWPLWGVLGVQCVRRPWFKAVWLTVSAPVMFAIAYMFLCGKWAG